MSTKGQRLQRDRRRIRAMEKDAFRHGTEVPASKMAGRVFYRRYFGRVAVDTDGSPLFQKEPEEDPATKPTKLAGPPYGLDIRT